MRRDKTVHSLARLCGLLIAVGSFLAVLHHPRQPSVDLGGGEVFLVGGNRPNVAERIDQLPAAISIELVLDRLLNGPASGDGLSEHRVGILDVQHQADR